jgi:hypothetical protein
MFANSLGGSTFLFWVALIVLIMAGVWLGIQILRSVR